MGNSSGKEFQDAWHAFDAKELSILERMFKDLSARSTGKTLDKDTFLNFFSLPGVLGERLFSVFDTKHNGCIHFEEFLIGLASYFRGDMDEKLHMMFKIYDMEGRNNISENELRLMLYSLIVPTSHFFETHNTEHALSKKDVIEYENEDLQTKELVEDIVKKSFEQCDLDHDAKLSFVEFKKWISENPDIMQMLESILSGHLWSANLNLSARKDSTAGLIRARSAIGFSPSPAPPGNLPYLVCPSCHMVFRLCFQCGRQLDCTTMTCTDCGAIGTAKYCVQCGDMMLLSTEHCPDASAIPKKTMSASSADLMNQKSTEIINKSKSKKDCSPETYFAALALRSVHHHLEIVMQGYLYKRGRHLKLWQERWFVLRQNFLYQFHSKPDLVIDRVIFLDGCFIELMSHDEHSNRFGIEIHGSGCGEDKGIRRLYASSSALRAEWVRALRNAAHTVPIGSVYALGKELGHGRFSKVYDATHLITSKRYAVKVIEKAKINRQDREALRTEIAILKLVNHPNCVALKEVFESRDKIYIVMQLVSHGDLLHRILKKKSFSEEITKVMIWKLVCALRYLHARGIVHRDLKPENILCADKYDDTALLISDFGLSKFASPSEVMNIACGTLAYVAPEVLKMHGYSKAVDFWSIGCIMYCLLKGNLPFDGQNKDQIIARTLHGKLSFSNPLWRTISSEAIDLLQRLLDKDPKTRYDGLQTLNHPWFESIRCAQLGSPNLTHSLSMAEAARDYTVMADVHLDPAVKEDMKSKHDIVDNMRSQTPVYGGNDYRQINRLENPNTSPTSAFSNVTNCDHDPLPLPSPSPPNDRRILNVFPQNAFLTTGYTAHKHHHKRSHKHHQTATDVDSKSKSHGLAVAISHYGQNHESNHLLVSPEHQFKELEAARDQLENRRKVQEIHGDTNHAKKHHHSKHRKNDGLGIDNLTQAPIRPRSSSVGHTDADRDAPVSIRTHSSNPQILRRIDRIQRHIQDMSVANSSTGGS